MPINYFLKVAARSIVVCCKMDKNYRRQVDFYVALSDADEVVFHGHSDAEHGKPPQFSAELVPASDFLERCADVWGKERFSTREAPGFFIRPVAGGEYVDLISHDPFLVVDYEWIAEQLKKLLAEEKVETRGLGIVKDRFDEFLRSQSGQWVGGTRAELVEDMNNRAIALQVRGKAFVC